MSEFFRTENFPIQRVSDSEKSQPKWYANCIDWIIDAGVSINDRSQTERSLNILHGDIPNEFYKKTLNPYNSSEERYRRFPAVMRNLDIMSDVIRRYVSEYIKSEHDFMVGSNNPDIVINKNKKLRDQVSLMAQQAFVTMFEEKMKAAQQEAMQNGEDPNQINPQDLMPNIEDFVKDFEKNYIDEESQKGQNLFEYIKSVTEDVFLYTKCYFNYVALGECYSYTEVKGDKILKESIDPVDAYPIPNGSFFVEDHDMFARKMMLSYDQIIDMFDETLSKKDRDFLNSFYAHNPSTKTKLLTYDDFHSAYPDVCEKFSDEERNMFRKQPINIRDLNTNLYEVWHVVWRGYKKVGIVKYINQLGFESEKNVDEDYKLNPEAGDLDIYYLYVPQVYEGYRIGARTTAIYPIKARAIKYNRGGKLPYNGVMEVLPGFGKFSIIEIITPFQIMRNIISYHREMVIAKNKMFILLMPESLVESNSEDRIYKMAADGVLYYDDSEDANSIKAQQIRLLNANLGDYITQLTNLIETIKYEARELVDMNEQRYGQISQSAGVQNTQEAIARSSMGSVLIVSTFDEFRKRDYNRDLDYAKFAFVDGINESYWDNDRQRKYISLDADSLLNLDLSTTVNNSEKDKEKLNNLKQWAFNASQNGDLEIAVAAITSDNIAAVKKNIMEFQEMKRQHEEQMKQMDQMIQQQAIQQKLQEIQTKGEEDRKTMELKYYYELQLKGMDVNLDNLLSKDDGTPSEYENSKLALEQDKLNMQRENEASKTDLQREKLNNERLKIQMDMFNKAADRDIKREDMKNKLKIATTNKNRYDK